jgi:hypothetical protein
MYHHLLFVACHVRTAVLELCCVLHSVLTSMRGARTEWVRQTSKQFWQQCVVGS